MTYGINSTKSASELTSYITSRLIFINSGVWMGQDSRKVMKKLDADNWIKEQHHSESYSTRDAIAFLYCICIYLYMMIINISFFLLN